MHPRKFLQEMEGSPERERLIDMVFEEMIDYCDRHDITTSELSNDELEELAESFVERGFGLPPSQEEDWRKL